jgi:UDP-glucose 4-epimerase
MTNYFDRKTILITGGGGYLGSKLAGALCNISKEIILLDIFFNDFSKSLAAENSNVSLITANIENKESLSKVFDRINPNIIFHFAASLDRKRDVALFDRLLKINVLGTLNLLESLKNVEYDSFYFASTSEVYGINNPPPYTEDQIPEPASPYSATKLMAEILIKSFSQTIQKPHTILRLFNFFGPGMHGDTFFGQILQSIENSKPFLMTKGEQKRDFLYIDDLIDQIIFIASQPELTNDTYNMCSGTSKSLIEIVQCIQQLTNRVFRYKTSLKYRQNEIWDMYGSIGRLHEIGYPIKENDLKLNLKKFLSHSI